MGDTIPLPDPQKVKGLLEIVKAEIRSATGNGSGPDIEAKVKSVGERLELQLEKDNLKLNFMLFNLKQNYWKNLNGWSQYEDCEIHGEPFGLWIFRSGEFENQGIGSYENWRFGGYKGGNLKRSGEPVKLFRKWYWPFSRYEGDGRLVTFYEIN